MLFKDTKFLNVKQTSWGQQLPQEQFYYFKFGFTLENALIRFNHLNSENMKYDIKLLQIFLKSNISF